MTQFFFKKIKIKKNMQELFYSTLKGSNVSDEDYEDLLKLWNLKKFKNLLDMYEFYCSLG